MIRWADTPGGRRWTAWAATAVAAWLLFWPFASDESARKVAGFDKAVHVALFGGLAWAWGRALGGDASGAEGGRRRWKLAGTLGLATLAVEAVQPLTGRSFDLWDAAAGCAGIAAAAVLCRQGLAWIVVALCALGLGCMARGLWNWGTEWQAFPVLADGGGGCWGEDWHLRGVEGEPTPEGLWLVASPEGPETWRGAFRVPVRSDWSRFGDWKFRVDWGGPEAATLVVRLDDRRMKHPPYAERFQREWTVVPGWNELTIAREEWSRASGGGELDVSDIARWGVFLRDTDTFDHWTLGKTALQPMNERLTP